MFSIIIPVYNNFVYTISCLRDLEKLPKENYEIIIVDNGSTDSTCKFLSARESIKYIRLNENKGFAYACNIGYQNAIKDNILFLNNDIKVEADFEFWPEIFAMESKYGLVSPTVGLLDKKFNFVKETNHLLGDKNSYLSAWCISAHKDIWKKLEVKEGCVFDEMLGKSFYEDVDLSFRAKKLNIPLYCKQVPVTHYGHKTANMLNISDLYMSAQKKFIKKWK